MQENLPAINKESFFSKIFQKIKKVFKKEKIDDEHSNVTYGLIIYADEKTIRINGSYSHLMERFEELGVSIKNNEINLDELPLEKKNIVLHQVVDAQSNFITCVIPDDVIDKTPEMREEHNNIFSRVNTLFNLLKFMEKVGKPMSEDKKYDRYMNMLQDLQQYYEKTSEKCDTKNERDSFMERINRSVPTNISKIEEANEQYRTGELSVEEKV